MADHPDHQDRPLPFENPITVFPANVGAYRSTAVQVDNSGGSDAAVVRATWSMGGAGGGATWDEKTIDPGKTPTVFFLNQGDTLESVAVTGGGGGTILAVFESNQLPLPRRATVVIPYAVSGALTVANGALRWYAPAAGMITLVHASVGTAPGGGGTTVRVNVNGSSVGTATIAAGANSATFVPGSASFVAGDYVTVDVTAANGASDLVVQVRAQLSEAAI